MVLFREHSTQFKGLYEFDPLAETLTRIFGIGPRVIAHDMVVRFFKYAFDQALRRYTHRSLFTHCADEPLTQPIYLYKNHMQYTVLYTVQYTRIVVCCNL